jgi:hypothetical protein
MSAQFSLINNFTVALQGNTVTGKQGDADDGFSDPEVITITGKHYRNADVIPTATVRTLWDEDSNFPATWLYLHFWADATVYLQLIAQATNVKLKVVGEIPFTMSVNSLLAAADTTLITGGSEPTLSTIDSIAIGNYTGNDVNYKLDLFL